MKTRFTYIFLIVAIAFSIMGCKKDGPPPTGINVITPLSGEPGGDITFGGIFNDDYGLTQISIEYLDWSLSKTIDLSDEPLTYTLDFTFQVPTDASAGDHTIIITAYNNSEKMTEFTVVVSVSEPISYDAIYAVGGFMWWWGWDNVNLSYPMTQDENDPNWYEIDIPVWGGDFNTVKFLGQPGWEGDNWGLVSSSDPSMGMINGESSESIYLDDKGKNPAYYRVRFNPYEMTYTAEELIPDIPVQANMYIVGNGYPEYPNLDWNTTEAIPLQGNLDGYGEHIFGIYSLELSSDVSMKFIGQTDGWKPLDVGFEIGGELQTPLTWVKCVAGDGTADVKFKDQAGKYTVVYDHFLKRALIWQE